MARQVAQRTRIFAGCEGDSERSYVAWLQIRSDEFNLQVHFETHVVGGGDPLHVVEESIKAMRRKDRQGVGYAHRAIFLDSDKLGQAPQRDQKIPALLSRNNIVAIYQSEVHEALLLRHFDATKMKRPPKVTTDAELRKIWEDYNKPRTALELDRKIDFDNLYIATTVEPELRTFVLQAGFFL